MRKNILHITLSVLALIAVPVLLVSCGDDDDDSKGGTGQSNNVNANIAGLDQSVCGYEMPHLNSKYDYICHKLSNGDVNYSLEYDRNLLHARWVAYTYNGTNAKKNYSVRTDAWRGEPYYDSNKAYQLSTSTFPNGYNRGHIVGSAERYYSQEANEQTFYMSNMTPMNGAFNSTYWGEIEDKARDIWGRGVIDKNSSFYQGTLYIVKGGSLQQTASVPDPTLRYITVKNTLGHEAKMPVPHYYFMACLFVSKTGTMKSIGFWLEHKDFKNSTASALQTMRRNAACSIDELEKKTGYDFFCNLPDNAEDIVESSFNITQWPGM